MIAPVTAGKPATARSRWTGRGELVVVAVLLVLACYLSVATATMEAVGDSTPGPQFFPTLVCILLYVVGGALTVQVLRRPSPHQVDGTDEQRHADRGAQSGWKTIGTVVAALILFVMALEPVGWLLSAAMLFWLVNRALGGRRLLFDLSVAILLSAVVQIAFSAGLGLSLPPGLLLGVF